PVSPVERLEHERHDAHPPAAENDRIDRHALRVLELRTEAGALGDGRGEAAVRMRRRSLAGGRPVTTAPVDAMVRRPGQPLPPDSSVGAEADVRENRVAAAGGE